MPGYISLASLNSPPLRLAADTDPVNNSTTMAPITGLAFPIAAGETAIGRFVLFTSGDATADFRCTIGGPASPTHVRFAVVAPRSADGVALLQPTATAFDQALTSIGTATTGLQVIIEFAIVNGANAGTITPKFAQQTVTVADTFVLAGSYVEFAGGGGAVAGGGGGGGGESFEAFDITNPVFGAVGDGVTNDTAAIQAAITAAAAAGRGTVYAPAGNYAWTGTLTFPQYVGLVGDGQIATQFTALAASSKLAFGDLVTSGGVRGPRVGGFRVHGSDLATQLFYVGLCVEREFFDIDVTEAAGDCIVIEGAQNCLFSQVNGRHAGGSALVVDLGAGSNTFVRCEHESALDYNVRFQQSDDPVAGTYPEPSDNVFIGGLVERLESDAGLGLVYHGAGMRNKFIGYGFSIGTMTTTANKPLITVRKDGTPASSELLFDTCQFFGKTVSATLYHYVFDLGGICIVRVSAGCTFTNFDTFVRVQDNGNRVRIGPNINYNGITNKFVAVGGTDVQANVIQTIFYERAIFRPVGTTATTALSVFVDGDGRDRLTVAAGGSLAWGDGTNPVDTNLYRSGAGILRSDAALLVGTFARLAGTAGTGYLQFDAEQSADPAAPAANQARLFLKDNGAGSTQLCARFATGATRVLANELGPVVEVNAQSGTAYTLVLLDVNKVVERTNAAASTVTVPLDSSVAFPIGALIEISAIGAGALTVVATSGVTVNVPVGLTMALNGRYATARLRKRAVNTWLLSGDLVPV